MRRSYGESEWRRAIEAGRNGQRGYRHLAPGAFNRFLAGTFIIGGAG